MSTSDFSAFIQLLTQKLENNSWQKLLLSSYQGEDTSLVRIEVRPVVLKDVAHLSFLYRHKTRDITKNFTVTEGLQQIQTLLGTDFKAAHFTALDSETQLSVSKKGKVLLSKHPVKSAPANTPAAAVDLSHNKAKQRYVEQSRPYLQALGITDAKGDIIPAMSKKWKQINKFIEVLAKAVQQTGLAKTQQLHVADFGSGKAYLTFAVFDYLTNTLGLAAKEVIHRHAAIDVGVLIPLHSALSKRTLRCHDFLEQGVLSRFLFQNFGPDFQLVLQDRVRRFVELDFVFGLQLDVVLRITIDCLPRHVGRRGLDGAGDDGSELGRQPVVLGLVEHHLESLGALVVALQHADFGDVGEAQQTVRRGVVEFSAIEQTTVHRRNDLAAWQGVHSSTHGSEQVNGQTVGTELQTFQVSRLGDRLFEPTERLSRHGAVEEGLNVAANGGVQLGQQLSATAVLVPSQNHVGIHAEGGAGVPQGQSVLLAVVVTQHAVATVQSAFGHGFEQAKCRHHSTSGQHFDLQIATGHVVDFFGVVQGVLVEDVLGRPCALPAHRDRARLGRGDHGCRNGTSGDGGTLQEVATAGGFGICHGCLQSLLNL